MNDLQEQLTRTGVENENGTVDGLRHQIAFEGLVCSDTIDIGIVDKPNDLVREQFRIILRR